MSRKIKEQADPKFQELKERIEKQKAIYEPLKEQCDKEQKKLFKLEDKLEKYRLEHGMFYPLSKLAEFKDEVEDISEIKIVQKKKNGKFCTYYLIHDDILEINDNGIPYYSSFEGGIIQKEEDGKWHYHYHFSDKILDDFVGFMSIEFYNSANKHDIAPPDIRTYKE